MDHGRELLRKLMAILTPVVPAPARAPEPSAMDKLVQLLIRKLAENRPVPPAPPAPAEPTKLEMMPQTYFRGKQSPSQQSRPRPVRRNWTDVKCFFMWTNGPQCDPLPSVRRDFPIYFTGVEGREDINWLLDDIAKDGDGPPAGGKRRLIRRKGFASRISKNTRPHDSGGGGDY